MERSGEEKHTMIPRTLHFRNVGEKKGEDDDRSHGLPSFLFSICSQGEGREAGRDRYVDLEFSNAKERKTNKGHSSGSYGIFVQSTFQRCFCEREREMKGRRSG
jgi:hypothetical protein